MNTFKYLEVQHQCNGKFIFKTRIHSSRMRTARSLNIGGVPARGCTCPGGCTCQGGPAQVLLPPVDRILDTRSQKLSCPNFVAGGNNNFRSLYIKYPFSCRIKVVFITSVKWWDSSRHLFWLSDDRCNILIRRHFSVTYSANMNEITICVCPWVVQYFIYHILCNPWGIWAWDKYLHLCISVV